MPGSGGWRVLVVEHDARERDLLRVFLKSENFQVYAVVSLGEGLRRIECENFDIVLLDPLLSDGSAMPLVQRFRHRSDLPLIIITADADPGSCIDGLDLGADDYVVRPVDLRELLARMRAVLRRAKHKGRSAGSDGIESKRILEFGGWRLDFARREVKSFGDVVCQLTTTEFELLGVLASHPRQVLSRNQIARNLRGRDWDPNDRTIDNLVVKLRRKIAGVDGEADVIETVRGVGYCLSAEVVTREVRC